MIRKLDEQMTNWLVIGLSISLVMGILLIRSWQIWGWDENDNPEVSDCEFTYTDSEQ